MSHPPVSTDVSVPDLTERQLNALDRLFPERSADPLWSDREVWIKAGERRVVRFLIEQFNRQHHPHVYRQEALAAEGS